MIHKIIKQMKLKKMKKKILKKMKEMNFNLIKNWPKIKI